MIQDPWTGWKWTGSAIPVEQLQWATAQGLLGRGISVVLENGFWSSDQRLAYRETAKSLGARVFLHLLDVPNTRADTSYLCP